MSLDNTIRIGEGEALQNKEEKRGGRVHRVGTVSLGLTLIGFGIAYLLRLILPDLQMLQILQYWPAIMIVLGTEVLLAGIGKRDFVIDKAAVVLMFLVVFFLFGMAGAEVVLTQLSDCVPFDPNIIFIRGHICHI